jgi:hypothetical protein
MAPTDLGNYDFVMPATYFTVDGARHAYVVGFGQARGDQKVFHATSTDGVDWLIDAADPFVNLGVDYSPPGPIPGSVLRATDGTWLMYLWGIPAPLQDGAELWRATSATPAGPWIADAEPVLEVGERGAWDDHGLDFPAVVPTANGYRMLYGANGRSKPASSAIGRATSADGRTWQRDPLNPVVTSALCGDTPDQASLPRVIQRGEQPSVLIWQGGMDIRIATSTDEMTWRCASDEPALTAADLPDSEGIHTVAAALDGSDVSLLVESLVPTGVGNALKSELWLARATPISSGTAP